jgi:hypothetical protein
MVADLNKDTECKRRGEGRHPKIVCHNLDTQALVLNTKICVTSSFYFMKIVHTVYKTVFYTTTKT